MTEVYCEATDCINYNTTVGYGCNLKNITIDEAFECKEYGIK